LRAALPKIRRDSALLADEIELVRAYLALHKIRMGERLEITMEVDDACLARSIPPMMLVTLAENAVKHGLAPLTEGGSINICVVRDGGSVKLSVADTGRGFVAESGGGVGLANLRAQLAALYGKDAALTLRANVPRGMVATITLPW
jgi:LytS/YehU family sensor histidine kinase